jgi:hypothetical protein
LLFWFCLVDDSVWFWYVLIFFFSFEWFFLQWFVNELLKYRLFIGRWSIPQVHCWLFVFIWKLFVVQVQFIFLEREILKCIKQTILELKFFYVHCFRCRNLTALSYKKILKTVVNLSWRRAVISFFVIIEGNP